MRISRLSWSCGFVPYPFEPTVIAWVCESLRKSSWIPTKTIKTTRQPPPRCRSLVSLFEAFKSIFQPSSPKIGKEKRQIKMDLCQSDQLFYRKEISESFKTPDSSISRARQPRDGKFHDFTSLTF